MRGDHKRGARRARGLSLLELMLVVGLVAIVSAIAVPAYTGYVDRARVGEAVAAIADMQSQIERFRTVNARLPATLVEAVPAPPLDPWGRPYVFYNYAANESPDPSRRDRNLRPINSEYDLYSRGRDGLTHRNLGNPDSEDDVVRGKDGSFVGLGKNF